jgi:AraC-like DNA-binding protein
MKPSTRMAAQRPEDEVHPCVVRAIAYMNAHVDEHPDQRLPLNELAAKSGLSMSRFSTVFRQHAGVSPVRYICQLRIQKVQALLAGGEGLASAALVAGFYDQSHLCRHFKSLCGMTPGQFIGRRRSTPAPGNDARELEAA